MSAELHRAWRYIRKPEVNLDRVIVRMTWAHDRRGEQEYVPEVVAAWHVDGKPRPPVGLDVLAEIIRRAAEQHFGVMARPVMLTRQALQEVTWEDCPTCQGLDPAVCLECNGFGHIYRVVRREVA